MAQRPPRMPRRHGAGPVAPEKQSDAAPADHAEPATDALNVVKAAAPTPPKRQQAAPAARPAPKKESTAAGGRRAKAEPAVNATKASSGKLPMVERAKEKKSERRREDRAKFSMAVRRQPGQKPEEHKPSNHQPVAAHRFSGRIAALLVLFAFFTVMLVPTVNHYRTQMAEISELRESIASMEAQRDDLKAEIARWDDPLYIKQQARERINLVMPGEKLYMVVGEKPEDESEETTNGSTYEVRQELPWVDALLDSVHRSATD